MFWTKKKNEIKSTRGTKAYGLWNYTHSYRNCSSDYCVYYVRCVLLCVLFVQILYIKWMEISFFFNCNWQLHWLRQQGMRVKCHQNRTVARDWHVTLWLSRLTRANRPRPFPIWISFALMFIDAVRGDFGHTFDSIECHTQNFETRQDKRLLWRATVTHRPIRSHI